MVHVRRDERQRDARRTRAFQQLIQEKQLGLNLPGVPARGLQREGTNLACFLWAAGISILVLLPKES